jgi:hypothetical protein
MCGVPQRGRRERQGIRSSSRALASHPVRSGRAALAAGPDVWEIIRAVKSARTAEPALADDGLLGLIADNTGTPLRLSRTAVRYWASYPDGIDAEIAASDAAEDAAEQAWRREHELLAAKAFPQNRSFTSAVVSALATLLDEREQIEASQITFLTRH